MEWLEAAAWGALAAVSLPLGAWLALRFRPSPRIVGLVMGFGVGALLGAVAYELIPAESSPRSGTVAAFGVGAVVFYLVDRAATGRHKSGDASGSKSIVLGALLDGIPESLVLGMSLATGGEVSIAFLAAVFMSNLPEALGATSGMRDSGERPGRIYRVWVSIVAVSAVCAALGYGLVQALPEADGHYVEAFAAGAVLTMLASSMLPEARSEGGRLTGLLTALGFAVAAALTLLE